MKTLFVNLIRVFVGILGLGIGQRITGYVLNYFEFTLLLAVTFIAMLLINKDGIK